MFSAHVGFKKESSPEPILQKAYLYLSPEGEIGITKKNLEKKTNRFVVSYCQGLKKNLSTTTSIVERILDNFLMPLEIYCFVDDLSFNQILELLEKDKRVIFGENVFTYQEEVKNKLEDRISEVRNYLNMNEDSYVCLNEDLKYNIYLELNRIPLSASAISFLLSAEDEIAPSYQQIAEVQAQFRRYGNFPFDTEIHLAEVTKLFDR